MPKQVVKHTISHEDALIIRDFRPADQAQARKLILSGLKEHWGTLDPTLNPDLRDIAKSYADGVFLVAEHTKLQRIAATGALMPRGEGVGEIVRMSVARPLRRYGLGTRLLQALVDRGRALGLRQIILETTETWREVIAFYQRFGFRITHHQDGDVYFAFDLDSAEATASAVALGAQVEVELVDNAGGRERLTFTLVPDNAADFTHGLLGENTPLAKAIWGRPAGSVVPYRAGDMKEAKVLTVTPGTADATDLSERRAATRENMLRDADKTDTLIFSTAAGSKWGDYDAGKLEE